MKLETKKWNLELSELERDHLESELFNVGFWGGCLLPKLKMEDKESVIEKFPRLCELLTLLQEKN